MKGYFEVRHHLDLGNGATCDVTDTSPVVELDPDVDGPGFVAEEFPLSGFTRIDEGHGPMAWAATLANGTTALVTWRAA